MSVSRVAIIWLGLAATACGDDTLTGTVAGAQMTISSSAAQSESGEIAFILSSAGDVCGDLLTNAGEAGTSNLSLVLRNTDSTGTVQPLATGTFMAGSGNGLSVEGQYEKFPSDCTLPVTEIVTGGSLVVTTINTMTGALIGTLDLDFGDDHLSGGFSADACANFNQLRCVVQPQ